VAQLVVVSIERQGSNEADDARRWWVSCWPVDSSTEINRASWDERAPAHAASPGYERHRFIDDPSFLSAVVRFDMPLLGDIRELSGVHLQCHIGTDTISLGGWCRSAFCGG
jgi:hypothetical protein